MTNGERIQSMFPNMNFGTLAQDDVVVNKDYSNNDEPQVFIPKRVWNAEYKEPTTKNDLGIGIISIKAVDDALYNYWHDVQCVDDSGFGVYQDSMEVINNLPSVTPIRPKGHWICDGKGRSFADYHCSECGLKLALCGQDIKQRQDSGYSLFCGGCGADMREAEE